MGLSGRSGYILDYIALFGTGYAGFRQVLYLGRAPRTKETLPDFREKCRVTRHSRVFRGLTGSQRTLGFWGVTISLKKCYFHIHLMYFKISQVDNCKHHPCGIYSRYKRICVKIIKVFSLFVAFDHKSCFALVN